MTPSIRREGFAMVVNTPVRDGPTVPGPIRLPSSQQCVCDLRLVEGQRPARLARKVLHVLLGGLGVPADQTFEIEEAVSELATNAEMHGRSPRRVRVYVDDRSLWVGVLDGDFHTAELVDRLLNEGNDSLDLMSEHGRGLRLAYAACHGECGVRSTHSESGKEILLCFPAPFPLAPVSLSGR